MKFHGAVVAAFLICLGITPQIALAVRPAPSAESLALPAAMSRGQAAGKVHQATGEVLSISTGSLMLLHARGRGKQRMEFTLTPQSKEEIQPAKGERIIVYYRNEGSRRIVTRLRSAARTSRKRRSGSAKSQS
jgi:hypothetical protein